MSPDMEEEPSDRFITLMMRLRRLAPEQAAQISPSAMAIIDFVASEPYCGVKDVARGLEVSAPTVSVAVRQLEDAGLIARQAHPRDRRAVQLFLTAQGQEIYDQTYLSRRKVFERLLASLTEEEQEIMLELLTKALDDYDATINSHS